ncbi:DUF2723 domain-containing protein [Draconibacterium sp. IB214405]|uniref:DUF2723 domain-containing protein n=1 Tax=Draconibacterium sp. IB214405 TaxID=3097352 RepID=UPI002A0B3C3C|nr:DUF2723 domain-containing protein [Draconibacterium sp. IB214405]MDX8339081.1 DUF2723 domain-containing protein [Draconibacterium sp. IB214405]
MRTKSVVQITGLLVFLISLTLYVLSLEPTTSFWDCSEFILSASKLEVNHPAGAPLFMLMGRLFSLLSFGNPQKIAWTINLMSGLFSALTIFLLYHVIVKLVSKMSESQLVIIGSAVIGALSFAVSDSFWFSAVEGEAYALSMFFLILSFWAALKWDEHFGQPGNEKWILFLALITGLGIGVHLLNLLVLPSVVMIMGIRKYGYSVKNLIVFFGLGLIVLLGVLYVLTPLVLFLLSRFDLFFVNRLSLPLHSGTLFGILFILALLAALIFYFKKKQKSFYELSTLSLLFVLLGFSVYAVNIIRSSANPPVNFGEPNNIFSLINYLNREQYPKRPLLYGQNYNSPLLDVNERTSYDFINGKYQPIDLAPDYEYDERTCTWFPRMSSSDENHIKAYNSWINISGKRVVAKQRNGEQKSIIVPRFSDQLKFFARYQFGFMFGRYFMWNFVGRQNDRQGKGSILNGNWLSGIDFVDNVRLGSQDKVPGWLKSNKGRNTYFFLPLLMGLFGAFYQYKTNREAFFIVLALFVMGGLGLTVYINEIPITPRERDYVFVGAFMAFSIWGGLSLVAAVNLIQQKIKNTKVAVPVLLVLLLVGPVLMASQNFDDHNRSGRYVARDLAENILKSCPPNAILFTSGDNDTYPLLYCQEVEELRTDVRIVIMPFLAANWFINGLRNPKYNDAGLKMILAQDKYDHGELAYVPVLKRSNRDTSWQEALNFLSLESNNAKVTLNSGERVNFLPITKLNMQVEADGMSGKIPVSIEGKNVLYKHELAFWDIISSNAAERPICFVSKNEAVNHGLGAYLQCEGFVYRLIPEKGNSSSAYSIGKCDPEVIADKLINNFKWGNISDPSVYADWNTNVNLNVFQARNTFNEVAAMLLQKGEKEKAFQMLQKCAEEIQLSKIPHDIFTIKQVELMFATGHANESQDLFETLEKDVTETLEFYESLNDEQQLRLKEEIQRELYYLNQLIVVSSKFQDQTIRNELEQKMEHFYQRLMKVAS